MKLISNMARYSSMVRYVRGAILNPLAQFMKPGAQCWSQGHNTGPHQGQDFLTTYVSLGCGICQVLDSGVIIQRNAYYESGKNIYLLITRSFTFQQLFFYDIILRNAYFTSYRSLSIRQSTDFLPTFWHNKKKEEK